MRTVSTLLTIVAAFPLPVYAGQSHAALHRSFSRSLAIGIALVLLVQAGHLVYRRLSRGTRLARLQRIRRNRP